MTYADAIRHLIAAGPSPFTRDLLFQGLKTHYPQLTNARRDKGWLVTAALKKMLAAQEILQLNEGPIPDGVFEAWKLKPRQPPPKKRRRRTARINYVEQKWRELREDMDLSARRFEEAFA